MTVAESKLADLPPADPIMADLTMAELMSGRPAAVAVLLRHGLACPGCAMAPFMTVREAAEAYGLELGTLLDEIAGLDGRPDESIEPPYLETRRCTP